jgi:hypothetical protein
MVGFELEALCGRQSPQPKSRPGRDHGRNGGEGGIRTHGRVSPTLAFEASSFDHSDTSPRGEDLRLTDASLTLNSKRRPLQSTESCLILV